MGHFTVDERHDGRGQGKCPIRLDSREAEATGEPHLHETAVNKHVVHLAKQYCHPYSDDAPRQRDESI